MTKDIITEMQQIKADNPGLELQDILRILNIKAMRDLAFAMRNGR